MLYRDSKELVQSTILHIYDRSAATSLHHLVCTQMWEYHNLRYTGHLHKGHTVYNAPKDTASNWYTLVAC